MDKQNRVEAAFRWRNISKQPPARRDSDGGSLSGRLLIDESDSSGLLIDEEADASKADDSVAIESPQSPRSDQSSDEIAEPSEPQVLQPLPVEQPKIIPLHAPEERSTASWRDGISGDFDLRDAYTAPTTTAQTTPTIAPSPRPPLLPLPDFTVPPPNYIPRPPPPAVPPLKIRIPPPPMPTTGILDMSKPPPPLPTGGHPAAAAFIRTQLRASSSDVSSDSSSATRKNAHRTSGSSADKGRNSRERDEGGSRERDRDRQGYRRDPKVSCFFLEGRILKLEKALR